MASVALNCPCTRYTHRGRRSRSLTQYEANVSSWKFMSKEVAGVSRYALMGQQGLPPTTQAGSALAVTWHLGCEALV